MVSMVDHGKRKAVGTKWVKRQPPSGADKAKGKLLDLAQPALWEQPQPLTFTKHLLFVDIIQSDLHTLFHLITSSL